MLEIVRYNEDEYDFPCLLVLGCFDALHVGHDELLKKAKLQAKINGLDLGVMLFAEGKGGKNLYSFEERMSLLEKYNVKFVLKIDFTEEFKKIKPLDFLACLEDKLNVKAYMSGKDFRFGCDKKGKSSTLKTYAEDEENGVWYMSVKDVVADGEKVSTTGIKALLEQGDVKKAAELLGRNYAVSGTVIKGADRGGKTLGFPTVNIEYPENKFAIKHGVYKVLCKVDENAYEGIANFGVRPTFGETNVLLEAYLKDFEGSLYEKTVAIEFLDYIRDIKKFEDSAALSAQLARDLSGEASDELAVASDVMVEESETTSEPAAPVEPEPVTEPVAPAEVTEQETTEEPATEIPAETTEEPVTEEPVAPAEETPLAEQVVPAEVTEQETAEEPAETELITEQVAPAEETPVTEPAAPEETQTAEEIERENEDFERELEETVIVENNEIREINEGCVTKEEKAFERTDETVATEPVEEELQPEITEEPVEVEESNVKEVLSEKVAAEEGTVEEIQLGSSESETEAVAEEISPVEETEENEVKSD